MAIGWKLNLSIWSHWRGGSGTSPVCRWEGSVRAAINSKIVFFVVSVLCLTKMQSLTQRWFPVLLQSSESFFRRRRSQPQNRLTHDVIETLHSFTVRPSLCKSDDPLWSFLETKELFNNNLNNDFDSVTRRLDYLINFWSITEMKNCQIAQLIFKQRPNTLKCCQSGEISPHLVTLNNDDDDADDRQIDSDRAVKSLSI